MWHRDRPEWGLRAVVRAVWLIPVTLKMAPRLKVKRWEQGKCFLGVWAEQGCGGKGGGVSHSVRQESPWPSHRPTGQLDREKSSSYFLCS